MSNVIPVAQIAQLLSTTPEELQQLSRAGVIPKMQDGGYDLAATAMQYTAHLRNLTVSSKELAEWVGLEGPRQIQYLAKDGVLEKEGSRYPLKKNVAQYCAYQRAGTAASGRGETDDEYSNAKRRKAIAEADVAEMEAQAMAGALVSADDVQQQAANSAQSLSNALMVIPDRDAPKLVTMDDQTEIHDLLTQEIRTALDGWIESAQTVVVSDLEIATKPDEVFRTEQSEEES